MAYSAGTPPSPSSSIRFRGTCTGFFIYKVLWWQERNGFKANQSVRVIDIAPTTGMQTESKIRMSYSRIRGAEEDLAGRAGFGMPTFDHPVGGTCVAVGHPEVRTGKEPGVWGGSLLCQREPRPCCRVLRQASRMCAVAGYFSRCSSGITRWSLRALFDGGSLMLRLRWLWGRIGGYLAAVTCLHPKFCF